MRPQTIAVVASVLAGLGVALGAFGAHALEAAVAEWELTARQQGERLATWEVAVRYQMYHALALFVVAWLRRGAAPRPALAAAWLLIVGIALFSGCLYLYVLTGVKWLGAIVPLGGTAFLLAWALIAVAAWRSRRHSG